MIKIKKITAFFSLCIFALLIFVACEGVDFSFKGRCKTSEDGFLYYEDKKIGVCIISLPESDDVTIPEYIDEKQVKQLGYEDIGLGYRNLYTVDGTKVKKLTIQHSMIYYSVTFPSLETLVFVDFLYNCKNINSESTSVTNYISMSGTNTKVELVSSDREYTLGSMKIKIINIPLFVIKIEGNVFNKISDLTIRTSYETRPEGWVEDWSGDCKVEWGVVFD